MKLTPGKLAGLQRVSDKRGVIAAAAMDQRGSPAKVIGEKKKAAKSRTPMMEEFKSLVTEILTPARQRNPARSGMGPARLEAPRQECRPFAGL